MSCAYFTEFASFANFIQKGKVAERQGFIVSPVVS